MPIIDRENLSKSAAELSKGKFRYKRGKFGDSNLVTPDGLELTVEAYGWNNRLSVKPANPTVKIRKVCAPTSEKVLEAAYLVLDRARPDLERLRDEQREAEKIASGWAQKLGGQQEGRIAFRNNYALSVQVNNRYENHHQVLISVDEIKTLNDLLASLKVFMDNRAVRKTDEGEPNGHDNRN